MRSASKMDIKELEIITYIFDTTSNVPEKPYKLLQCWFKTSFETNLFLKGKQFYIFGMTLHIAFVSFMIDVEKMIN